MNLITFYNEHKVLSIVIIIIIVIISLVTVLGGVFILIVIIGWIISSKEKKEQKSQYQDKYDILKKLGSEEETTKYSGSKENYKRDPEILNKILLITDGTITFPYKSNYRGNYKNVIARTLTDIESPFEFSYHFDFIIFIGKNPINTGNIKTILQLLLPNEGLAEIGKIFVNNREKGIMYTTKRIKKLFNDTNISIFKFESTPDKEDFKCYVYKTSNIIMM